MRPLISYYGGKQRIVHKLLPIVEAMPHMVYVEPFAGGAALLFAKNRRAVGNAHNYREVLNDTNDLIITLYRVAVKNPEALQLEIDATLYSQSDYAKAKEVCKNPAAYDDVTIAWAVYVNAQMSFSNNLSAGFGTAVFGRNHAVTWNNQKMRLPSVLRRLAAVYISAEDAIRCIERWDSPQTLFYCDPPYPGTYQGHYSGYTLNDWTALCAALDAAQGSYVLSNYAQPVEPQSAQQRIEINAVTSVSPQHRETRTEIVWTCDRSHNARRELKKYLYQIGMGI